MCLRQVVRIIMSEKRVTSIEIKNTSCGLSSADEIIAETLRIYMTGKIKHLQYNGLSDKSVSEYEYNIDASQLTFENVNIN